MASLSTYAKLYPPNQFRPEETATFRLQYSTDLSMNYATLVIDGYEDEGYKGTKITQWINTAVGGQGYEEFVVPAGTLGRSPSSSQSSASMNGKMRARVEIGGEIGSDGNVINPIFTSSSTLVDMLVMWDGDFAFENTPYIATGSSTTISLMCQWRHDFGVAGDSSVQGYRLFLYDSNYKLVFDSEEMYDWTNNIYPRKSYTFYDLQNNTTYYVKAQVTFNGGYVMTRGYETITVNYSDVPITSDIITLSSQSTGVAISIDLSGVEHTKVMVYRTRFYESDYMDIGISYSADDVIVMNDQYAIPGQRYTYRAVVYDNDNVVGTFYNNIMYTNNCVKISDVFGSYSALGKITKHPISRNDRGSLVETMDSIYPRHIINGAPNYDSGSVDGLFTDTDEECNLILDDNYLATKSDILRAWLNNGRAKLLTYYTGEAWIVAISGIQTTDPDNNDIYNTTFNWTQIGNANRISDYISLGLVTTDD